MENEIDENAIESLLKGVPLREPGAWLDSRVDAVFAQYRQTENQPAVSKTAGKAGSWVYLRNQRRFASIKLFPSPVFHRLAIAAGILLALSIGVRLSLPRHAQPVAVVPPIETPVSHPIRFEQETSTVFDDGIVASTDDAAYQQYRRRTVREIYYEDPKTHAKLQVTIPTEQVVIQKVDFN
jgi:hypothetical protein